jgi:hypothetical protein
MQSLLTTCGKEHRCRYFILDEFLKKTPKHGVIFDNENTFV